MIFEKCIKLERYHDKEEKLLKFKQKERWNRIMMANTHHLLIMVFSIYNFINPDCENPYAF